MYTYRYTYRYRYRFSQTTSLLLFFPAKLLKELSVLMSLHPHF